MELESTKVDNLPQSEQFLVYRERWVILGIFVIFSASNGMQWIQYSIITNVITEYYSISTTWVDWTSMLYLALYIPSIIPASYLLDRYGVRITILIGIIGTCAGSWIKVASVAPDRFWVGFLGQGVVALSQVCVLSIPSKLAAIWFGPSEVSSACSIGIFGNQLGIAIGFIFPPFMVDEKGDEDSIHHDLFMLFVSVAVVTTIILVLVIFFFKEAPPTSPSNAAAQQDSGRDFVGSLKRLLQNRSYWFLIGSYGFNTGIFYAISTLLNQIILLHYKDGTKDAGRIRLVIVVAGMVGSVIFGLVLDKFHKFKETTLALYVMSTISMIVYTFTISRGLILAYFVSALLGFFMTGLLPVGIELGTELTYPEPEGTSSGLLNASSQLFAIIFINIYSTLLYNLSDTWANVTMCVFLLIGTILTALISSDSRRQAAESSK